MAGRAFDTNITGLRGLWQLEDTADGSGVGQTLTNNGTVTFVAGNFSNAASLGTSNSTKSLSLAANPFASADPGNWSMGCWIKVLTEIPDSTVYHLMQFDTGPDATDAMAFFQYRKTGADPAARQIRIFVATDSGLDVSTYDVTLGTTDWHMMVLVRNGTSIKFYLDNVLRIDATATGSTGFAFTNYNFSLGVSRSAAEFASVLIDSAFLSTSVMPATGDYSVNDYYTNAVGPGAGSNKIFMTSNTKFFGA